MKQSNLEEVKKILNLRKNVRVFDGAVNSGNSKEHIIYLEKQFIEDLAFELEALIDQECKKARRDEIKKMELNVICRIGTARPKTAKEAYAYCDERFEAIEKE